MKKGWARAICVIYVCRDVIPPIEELAAGASNDDGGGVAWIDTIKGHPRVRWKKGLKDENEVFEVVKDLKPPVMIHFRLATIGGDTPLLTHPFPLTEKAPLALEGDTIAVLAHNGHWHKWDDTIKDLCARSGKKLPGGPWSDSRAMAWIVANFGVGMLNLTADYQKVAILHAVKGFSIINQGMWYEKKGWMQSSTTSKRNKTWSQWHGSIDDTADYGGGVDWQGRVSSSGIGCGTRYVPPPPSPLTDGVSFYKLHNAETAKLVVKPIRLIVGEDGGPKVEVAVEEQQLSLTSELSPTIVDAEVISAKTVTLEIIKTPKVREKVILGPDEVSEAEMEHYLAQIMHGNHSAIGHA